MNIKFKKIIALTLISVLLFFYVAYPAISYAQTVTDTPTPTPTVDSSSPTPTPTTDTSTATVTPTPTIDPNATSTDTPTPTPTVDPGTTPTDSPTPTTDPSLTTTPTDSPTPAPGDPTNIGTANNIATSSAVTGDNTIIATGSSDTSNQNNSSNPNNNSNSNSNSSSGNSSSNNIGTGEALSLINSDTGVNVTSINSNIINQTLNIFVAQNGSIDLSAPFTIAAEAISSHPSSPVINVSVTSVNNFAYITNEIASQAITGDNLINAADQSASITTGNSYSVVSLLNKVNFTIDNSQVHIVTINIFGNLNGNIILPDMNTSTNCNSCGISMSVNNNATVNNNVNSLADTGNNTATGSASITTGDSNSAVNIVNLINTNLFGTNAQVIFINNMGNWTGNFIGWGDLGPATGGANMVFMNFGPNSAATGSAGCSTCSGSLNSIYNSAYVTNNISSLADTGGNSLSGNGSIVTGNAYSAVSLLNFINSNFINSIGFFGFINIFGNWTGDIGGASEFAALNANHDNGPTPPADNTSSTNSSNSNAPQEQGGLLSVTNSNNVGAFVYPGDTVTFFEKTTNTGTGKVYGAKLNLFLIYQGHLAGGTQFNLGDIEPGHSVQVNTGFVLSKLTPPGYYIARAYVTGNVGPDNTEINAAANSSFTVFGSILGAATTNHNTPKIAVLGTKTNSFKASAAKIAEDLLYFSLLILVVFAYISLRLIRKREYVYAFFQSDSFKEKLYTLRMLLL